MIFTNGKGKVYDIPEEKVEDALSHGLEPGFEMRNKDGKKYVIPKSKFDDAVKGGLEHEPIYQARIATDNKYIRDEMKRMGGLEAAARGFVDGATFGRGANVAGLFRTPEEKQKIKENWELSDEAASIKYPQTKFLASQTPALATMGAATGGIKNALQSVAVGAAEGGSRNGSEGILEGAAWGSLPLAMEGVGAAKTFVKGAAKKTAAAAARVPEETISTLYNHNTAIKNAKTVKELTEGTVDAVEELAKKVSAESGDSFRILQGNNTQVPKSEFISHIQQSIDDLVKGGGGPERRAEVAYLKGIIDDASVVKGDVLDGGWVKNTIKGMYDRTTLPANAAEILPDIAKQTRMASGRINNQSLKSRDLDYAMYMEDLQRKADLLDRVKTPFGKKEQAYNSLKGIANDRSPFKAETLADLEAMTGKDFAQQAKFASIREAFTKPVTNGSRNVNLGANAGGMVGAALGYLADSLARPVVAKSIDGLKFIEPYADQLGKYGPVLKDALSRGNNYFLMTHRLLLEKDPEYRAVLEQK
jgi:hypothetical protein